LSGGHRNCSAASARRFRNVLSIAFSDDECKTWPRHVVIARKPGAQTRLDYLFRFEAEPGEMRITTMRGHVRLKPREADFV
jgi:sialidase-1